MARPSRPLSVTPDLHFLRAEFPVWTKIRITFNAYRVVFIAAIVWIGQEVMNLPAPGTTVWVVFLVAAIDMPQMP
jgi:hypothetical protein